MLIENKYPIYIVTGMIACGKSTFSKMLVEKLNALFISADLIAHDVLNDNANIIVSKFGTEILGEDNKLDRKRLGAIVFADNDKLIELEGIIHPLVNKKIDNIIQNANRPIVYEVALFWKSNYKNIANPTILYVSSSRENMIKRMISRGLTEKEATNRIKTQSDIEKLKYDDNVIVIDNDSTLEQLKETINKLIQ